MKKGDLMGLKELSGDIKTLVKDVNSIKISSAETAEHLKNLNGTVARHETDIVGLREENKAQSISIAKIFGVGLGGATLGGVIVSLITIVLK